VIEMELRACFDICPKRQKSTTERMMKHDEDHLRDVICLGLDLAITE